MAEECNPMLYKELMEEFKSCWKIADANNDDVLDCEEFKVFVCK